MKSLVLIISLLLSFCQETTVPLPPIDTMINRISWVKDNELLIQTSGLKYRYSWVYSFNIETGKLNQIIQNREDSEDREKYDEIFISNSRDFYAFYSYDSKKLGFIQKGEKIAEFYPEKALNGKFPDMGNTAFQIDGLKNSFIIIVRLYDKDPGWHWASSYSNLIIVFDKTTRTLDMVNAGQIKFSCSPAIDRTDSIVGFDGSTIYEYNDTAKKMLPVKTLPDNKEIIAVKCLKEKLFVVYFNSNSMTADLAVYDKKSDKFTFPESEIYGYVIGARYIAFLKKNGNNLGLYITNDFSNKRLLKTYQCPDSCLRIVMSPSEDKLAVLAGYEFVDIFDISDLQIKPRPDFKSIPRLMEEKHIPRLFRTEQLSKIFITFRETCF